MAETAIKQLILADAISEAIGDRKVKAAVFFTFQFDPGFFEEEILPVLFQQSFSHVPKVRLLQLEEIVRALEHIAVYYDQKGLVAGAKPAKLDYRRIAMSRPTGYFHPKNILILMEEEDEEFRWENLLVVTSSANLTESGWWTNVESAHIEIIDQFQSRYTSLRDDLLGMISYAKGMDPFQDEHPALEAIRSFLLKNAQPYQVAWVSGRLLPQIYRGKQTLADFFGDFIDRQTYNFEIISPYFDDAETVNTVCDLLEVVQPKETRIYLPVAVDGTGLCREGYYDAIVALPRVYWGKLPPAVTAASSSIYKDAPQRFVHAKVYRFWNQDRELLFIGSVNLTQAACSNRNAGNFETGILVEVPEKYSRWWLERREERKPQEFRIPQTEEVDPEGTAVPFTLLFNWDSNTLEYFWAASVTPNRVLISSQGITQFEIENIKRDAWLALSADAVNTIKTLLISTSIVDVTVNDRPSFKLLIREEGMAKKPSLLLNMTVEDILQYWSLLSPSQKEALLSARIGELEEGLGPVIENLPPSKIDSMFDRFAGIFHAFGRLESHVSEALENHREREAEYRLLGHKYDSLPEVVAKVRTEKEMDAVNRYVTLLCAKQTIRKIAKEFPDFEQSHKEDFVKLRNEIESVISAAKQAFSFDTPGEVERFLQWFERMFFTEVELPPEDEAA